MKRLKQIFAAFLALAMITCLFPAIAFAATDDDADDITYTMDSDEVLEFDDDDFSGVCDDLTGEDLDYVKFTLPDDDDGILYYDYDEDEDDNTEVSSTKKYYYDESPYIKKISFVPDEDYSGTVTIKYTAYDVEDDNYTGRIKITVENEDSTANTIAYKIEGVDKVINFDEDDFDEVCEELNDEKLDYVKFTIPSASIGILFYDYDNEPYSTLVSSSKKYYIDGSPNLSEVAFLPDEKYSGTATITYTGYDTDHHSYTGKIQVTVSSGGSSTGTPIDTSELVSSKYFKDVDISYSWAVPYIDSLYEAGIVSGATNGSFKYYSPAAQITRGDFMLLLYRALNFNTTSKANGFTDVPTGSYYYNAIMTAKALGIAQGSDNRFYPNNTITREDAMVFVLRAVNITGKTITSGDTNNLAAFSDFNSISDYSRSAVAALIKAGIITGSDDNKIYPKGNLTRAQVSAIIYRVKNM